MLRSFFVILSLATLPTFYGTSRAQRSAGIQWQRCIGGSAEDVPAPHTASVCASPDGGFVVAMCTNSKDGDATSNHQLMGQASYDILVTRFSPTGSVEWTKCLGGSNVDYPYSIIHTSDNCYVIAGSSKSTDGDVTGNHGDFDAWIVKLDSDGTIVWEHSYGGSAQDGASSILETEDSGYVFAGWTGSNDGDVTYSAGDGDMWLVKLSHSGALEWEHNYGGHGWDGANCLSPVNGGYVVAGWTRSNEEGFPLHVRAPNPNYVDAYVVKVGPQGDFNWQVLLGGSDEDEARAVLPTEDGGCILLADAKSTDGDVVGNHGNTDLWLVHLDAAGHIVWQKCYGGGADDLGGSLVRVNAGGDYLLCGSTNSSNGDVRPRSDTGSLTNGRDVWVFTISDAGTIRWQECLGGSATDEGWQAITTRPGVIGIIASSNSTDGDVSGNHGKTDGWFIQLDTEKAGVLSRTQGSSLVYPYPNPASIEVRQELSHAQSASSIEFFNCLGERFYPNYRVEGTTLVVNVLGLSPGVYVTRVTYTSISGGGLSSVQKFVISK